MAATDITTKCCSKCGGVKAVSEFSKCAKNRDGLQRWCKACNKARNAKWRAENTKRVIAYNAKWYAENTEKSNADSAKWRADNRGRVKKYNAEYGAKYRSDNHEKVKERDAKYYAKNRDKVREVQSIWRAANAELVRIYSHNRRARKREAGGKLSKGLAKRLFKLQRGKCACGCKQALGTDFHLDHIMPLALGGTNTDDNIQLLTSTCNQQKNAKHPVDFMQQRGFLL